MTPNTIQNACWWLPFFCAHEQPLTVQELRLMPLYTHSGSIDSSFIIFFIGGAKILDSAIVDNRFSMSVVLAMIPLPIWKLKWLLSLCKFFRDKAINLPDAQSINHGLNLLKLMYMRPSKFPHCIPLPNQLSHPQSSQVPVICQQHNCGSFV